MSKGGTFLTAIGEEHYGAFGQYSAADSDSSQSTLLLQKKKKMQEVQQELDRKKVEYEHRMRTCKEKENELAEKQEKIRESVIRFEKFVKENDAKRARALKKEKDEINARKQKEREIIVLRQSLEELNKQKELAAIRLERLSVKEYLESVVESTDEFSEIGDLLSRHATLKATHRDLRELLDTGDRSTEELRAMHGQHIKESEDRILVYTSEIGNKQKRLEEAFQLNAKLDQQNEYLQVYSNKQKRELGESKMAIQNIYHRCRKASHQKLGSGPVSIATMIEYVMQRMLDLGEICKLKGHPDAQPRPPGVMVAPGGRLRGGVAAGGGAAGTGGGGGGGGGGDT